MVDSVPARRTRYEALHPEKKFLHGLIYALAQSHIRKSFWGGIGWVDHGTRPQIWFVCEVGKRAGWLAAQPKGLVRMR